MNNNPVRYTDPTGHFAAIAAAPLLLIVAPEILAITAVVVAGIAVGILVGMAIDSYVSKNTINKTNQLINSYGNNGDNFLWNLSPKNNPWAWLIGGGVLAELILEAVTDGGCGQDESNCVEPTPTPTATPTPAATSTQTSTPTSTPTPTPTSTPTPSATPTLIPTPTYQRYGEQEMF